MRNQHSYSCNQRVTELDCHFFLQISHFLQETNKNLSFNSSLFLPLPFLIVLILYYDKVICGLLREMLWGSREWEAEREGSPQKDSWESLFSGHWSASDFSHFFFVVVVEVSRVQKASLFENSLQLAVNFCLLDLLITLICVSLSGSEIWSHWLKCFFSYFMKFSIMTSLTSSAQLSASRSSGIPFTWPSLRM